MSHHHLRILFTFPVCSASHHHWEKTHLRALVFLHLIFSSLVVIDVVFLVAGLPSIVSARLGFQARVVYGLKLKLWFLGGWLPFSPTQSFVVLRWHERLVCAC
ncbi:hypothetical protein F2Q69_00041956 [Brassica cretica]|uniref:Uncharacterized protein n=1 Tax=Brassica cretica TaxID=69181 RepID=A0A8S9N8K3_BRACR|nr:hypothetical protein F2Q69_00041956 [Brassica cretica]